MTRRKRLLFSLICFVVVFNLAMPISLYIEASPTKIYLFDEHSLNQSSVYAASTGSISGYVYQSDGSTPIAGAMVGVFDPRSPFNYGWVPTIADGSYTFGGLQTDTYVVRVEAEGYAVQWYQGVIDKRQATPVSVTAPDDTSGIDFTLEPGGSILGHVYKSGGITPIERAQIDVFDYALLPYEFVVYETAWTRSDGSYKTGGLPTGAYGVRVKASGYLAEWYYDTYNVSEATPVSISVPYDTTGIDFILEPTLADKAAQLTKTVLGVQYLWGGKGWDWELREFVDASEVRAGYRYRWLTNGTWPDKRAGLDCSGLVFWAYNRAYGATKYLDKQNPIQYDGADGQYRNNFNEDVNEVSLKPGDLLFFDFVLNSDYMTPRKDGLMDHVAMYVEPFQYGGEQYDCVHASYGLGGIVADAKNRLKTWEINGVRGFETFRRLSEPQVRITIKAYCPINLIVKDPDGFRITSDIGEIPGVLYYFQCYLDEDSDIDDVVVGPEFKTGDYLITIEPGTDAEPTVTYSVEVSIGTVTIMLAEDVQISDIPGQGYMVRSIENEIAQIILANIDFHPDSLNLKSQGKWVTVYIELPIGHGYDISQIDISSIKLNNTVNALERLTEIGDYDNDGIPDLMVKFDRSEVQEILPGEAQTEIIMSGQVEGITFEGCDIIMVVDESNN